MSSQASRCLPLSPVAHRLQPRSYIQPPLFAAKASAVAVRRMPMVVPAGMNNVLGLAFIDAAYEK
jgi:hypothetical protein